jgi:4-amino-4-deoxy-L-arabinose transferase-like glycosyltransferase
VRGSHHDRLVLALTATASVASLLVITAYVVRALALTAYPWDWSPDEGLFLDFGRRVVLAPATLYARTVVPAPNGYGPLYPLLLAPLVTLASHPLGAARLLGLALTLAGTAAVYRLVRRDRPRVLALASAALALVPFDLTFWHVLVRADGLMQTLWLFAAIPLLPRQLARGADSLSGRRLALGTSLLLLAVLAKPTAVIHGAPLVLGWFLVERRSAWRLCLVITAAGLAAIAVLAWSTSGAYLWLTGLFRLHSKVPGLLTGTLLVFAARGWPVILACLLALLAARRRWSEAVREPSLLLAAGGFLILPALSKFGASWNYLMPALAALAVVTGRWAGLAERPDRGRTAPPFGAAALATAALALAATRPFPLPTAHDERTARAFYELVQTQARALGGPILASRPELAYFVVGQPVEIEATSFPLLEKAGVAGTADVLQGLQHARYSLVLQTWPWSLPDGPQWREALTANYIVAGSCELQWYFGRVPSLVQFRRGQRLTFVPAKDARCSVRPTAP